MQGWQLRQLQFGGKFKLLCFHEFFYTSLTERPFSGHCVEWLLIAFSRIFQTTMCTKWVWLKSLQENSGKSPDNLRLNFGLICSRCEAHNLFEKSRIPEFFLNCSRYFVHQKVTLIVAKTVKFSQIFLIPRITTCTWHAQDTDSTVAVAFSRIFLDLPRCAQVTVSVNNAPFVR